MATQPEKKSESRASAKRSKKPAVAGKTVIVGNLKGGCGKSTVIFNLAVWLAARGDGVTLVDLDPQKTLTDVVNVREEIGISPSLPRPLDDAPVSAEGVTLIDFGAADIQRTEHFVPYADLILAPVLPSQADIWAVQRYLKVVLSRRKLGAKVALFVNRADPPAISRETREALAALRAMVSMCEGAVVLPALLGRRVAFCRSLSEGQGVFELSGQRKAAEEFELLARAAMALL